MSPVTLSCPRITIVMIYKRTFLLICRMYTVSRKGMGKKGECVGKTWVGVEVLEGKGRNRGNQ